MEGHMKFEVRLFFEILSIKVMFNLKSEKNNGTLHEDI